MKDRSKRVNVNHYTDGTASVLRKKVVFTELRFYQRSEVLYHLTKTFCNRFLPVRGDRTVDQMVQAARSTKQNIAEGCSDGQTSMESELKLLGIARGSNLELLEDYHDYINYHGHEEWFGKNPRSKPLHDFCREHSLLADYKPLFAKMNDEELANMAICLCHQIDKAITKYLERRDREFVTEGGIRERMTAARLEQRATQRETIETQARRIEAQARIINDLQAEVERLKSRLQHYEGGQHE